MIVAHLIGGNTISGVIMEGKVLVNGEEIPYSYQDLAQICGNIALGDFDVSSRDFKSSYAREISEQHPDEYTKDEALIMAKENHLFELVSYSTYRINSDSTITLEIDTYE